MIRVVNIIPKSLSGETGQDSEPNIAVNPANPAQIAITAFTPDPMGGVNAPVFISTDTGATWTLNNIVPSQDSLTGTGDITARFAGANNRFYAGILRRPSSLRLNILRTTNFAGAGVMTVLVDRNQVDQPYTQATTVASGPDTGKDRVYVGLNDFNAPGGKTATVETSLDAGAASPTFKSVRVEKRATSGQNGPQIRPAFHSDGTIYAIFYGWRAFSAGNVTADVVVVRDDNWGSGATPFTALKDPSDTVAGRLVATNVKFSFNGSLGHDRVGGDLSITVDPNNSSIVYIAFCDLQAGVYTIHVRRSTDRGATWSSDLKTISNAKNPALAINSSSTVGLAYQRVVGSGASQTWDTHLELTSNAFSTSQDHVLATVPAGAPAPKFLPFIGDYMHMLAVGTHFYGVFSANNEPDPAHFPQGVTYQRNHDFATKKLFAVNGVTPVAISIDPFFFEFIPTSITLFTNFTLLTSLTKLTLFTKFTPLTSLTQFTSLTKFTKLTSLTLFTKFTSFTPFTLPQFSQFVPPGVPVEAPAPSVVQPFIRFGNRIFAPEELDLSRFEPLEGVVEQLASLGITKLHNLASADPYLLSLQLGYTREDASRLIELAQQILRNLVQ